VTVTQPTVTISTPPAVVIPPGPNGG
jgi:hypothetical protein